jgi:hypothetical protein
LQEEKQNTKKKTLNEKAADFEQESYLGLKQRVNTTTSSNRTDGTTFALIYVGK